MKRETKEERRRTKMKRLRGKGGDQSKGNGKAREQKRREER